MYPDFKIFAGARVLDIVRELYSQSSKSHPPHNKSVGLSPDTKSDRQRWSGATGKDWKEPVTTVCTQSLQKIKK